MHKLLTVLFVNFSFLFNEILCFHDKVWPSLVKRVSECKPPVLRNLHNGSTQPAFLNKTTVYLNLFHLPLDNTLSQSFTCLLHVLACELIWNKFICLLSNKKKRKQQNTSILMQTSFSPLESCLDGHSMLELLVCHVINVLAMPVVLFQWQILYIGDSKFTWVFSLQHFKGWKYSLKGSGK